MLVHDWARIYHADPALSKHWSVTCHRLRQTIRCHGAICSSGNCFSPEIISCANLASCQLSQLSYILFWHRFNQFDQLVGFIKPPSAFPTLQHLLIGYLVQTTDEQQMKPAVLSVASCNLYSSPRGLKGHNCHSNEWQL